MKIKDQIIKLVSTLLIILIIAPSILLSQPKKVTAQGSGWVQVALHTIGNVFTGTSATNETVQTSFELKKFAQEIGRQVLMTIARRALQGLTTSTVNWINTGYWNNPLFIENPDSFFKDIAKYEIKNVVDTFGYDSRRFPFGKDFALNIIDQYNRKLEDNAEYTLSKVLQDPILLRNYQNDFNVGGWNGFLINTQYPQNNYVGFQMLATENLARKLAGTSQTATEKVAKTLDQGMGFLSPQICTTNPNYNNGKNEFKQPKLSQSDFDKNYQKNNPPPNPYLSRSLEDSSEDVENPAYRDWQIGYETAFKNAQTSFGLYNTCPPKPDGSSGFEVTTPGSVVGSQIAKALGGAQDQASLAAAMGNSISAITDAFINKFVGKGLNSLATKINPVAPEEDTWDYYGNTLGSPASGRAGWEAGPEQEIILSEFKEKINNDITNITEELALINNESVANPGLMQVLGKVWPQARTLDICIPGPDLGWEDRLTKERDRNSQKVQGKANDTDGKKAAEAQLAINELEFAVSFFKDWIYNKMITELPNSVNYMEAVAEIKNISQQGTELTSKMRARNQALARLRAIQTALSDPERFSSQPVAGSNAERILISLKRQYDAAYASVANPFTIEETRNDLNIAKEKLENLKTLTTQCRTERSNKNWNPNGGWNSNKSENNNTVNEKNLFCDAPIIGGYNHESYTHSNDKNGIRQITHPEIPYVNAFDVMNWKRFGGLFGTKRVNMALSCKIIFNSNTLLYKGDLPGKTELIENYSDIPEDIPIEEADPEEDTTTTTGGTTTNTTPTGQLTCSPANQTVHVGQNINFTATGGNGTYAWDQNDANPPTGNGSSWVTVWSEPSDSAGKAVRVTSGSEVAQCSVVIEP